MSEITLIDIDAHTGSTPVTLRFATQGFVNSRTPVSDPILDPRLTVSRAGVATRVNSAGLIESVPANTARFNYDAATKAIKGLLVEESRINLLRQSAQLSDALWTKSASLTVSPDDTTAPDGLVSGDKLTINTTAVTAHTVSGYNTATVNSVHTLSMYLKAGAVSKFRLTFANNAVPTNYVRNDFDLITGSCTFSNVGTATGSRGDSLYVGGGWWRVWVTGIADTSGTAIRATVSTIPSIGVSASYAGTIGDDIYIWGMQLEPGAFPTSYIPTEASTVTRNADVITMTGSNFSGWYNQPEGTFIANSSATDFSQADVLEHQVMRIIGGADIYVLRYISLGNGTLLSDAFSYVSGSYPVDFTGVVVTKNQLVTQAFAYKNNDFAYSVNGTTTEVDASSPVMVGAATTLELNYAKSVHIRSITYYPTRLTNAQLQLASSGVSLPSGAVLDLNFVGNANTYYEGRVKQPGNIQRTVFDKGTTFGASKTAYGEIVLVNNDGALDYLLSYGFAGFPIIITRGVMSPNQSTPTWSTVLVGTMDSVDFSWGEVSIKVRDRQQEMALPIQTSRYGGTNALPNGLDGVTTDIKGNGRPILYGKVFNFAPPQVNTTRLIYEVSDSLIQSIDAVYDRGTALTAGAVYTSQGDMETTAPSAGQYRVWLNAAGSYFRIGAAPVGTITVDASQGAATVNRTVAQLLKQAIIKGAVVVGDINATDVIALDAVAGYETGYWVADSGSTTVATVLDAIANSAGAWWGVDRLGKFRMGQIASPIFGNSIGTITSVDIIKIDRTRSAEQGGGVPAWQVKLNYAKMFTVQTDLAGTIPAVYKSDRAEEWRTIIANDASVKTQWPKAVEMEFNTYLTTSADASTEATRRLNIYKVRRDTLTVKVKLTDNLAAIIDLGATILVQVSRFGMSAGKPYLVTGIRTDLRNNTFDLTLWG